MKEKVLQKIQYKDRREVLEEYLFALILQGESPRDLFEKSKDILLSYNFTILSIGKIYKELAIYLKNNSRTNLQDFSSNLSKELMPIYDKCFLIPLPKFENSSKYEDEVIRISNELKIFSLKEKIQKISNDLKGKDTTLSDIEKIREEITKLTTQLAS